MHLALRNRWESFFLLSYREINKIISGVTDFNRTDHEWPTRSVKHRWNHLHGTAGEFDRWRSSLITLGFEFCFILLGVCIKALLVTSITKLNLWRWRSCCWSGWWFCLLSSLQVLEAFYLESGRISQCTTISLVSEFQFIILGFDCMIPLGEFKNAMLCYSHSKILYRLMITVSTERWIKNSITVLDEENSDTRVQTDARRTMP